jgi:flagellar biosynthesis protein FlhF
MYVRKFESETLDGALKAIKQELGPDAIILKTVTNKGLKGAFKKNKIEITAAISEKNYTKKAKVDHVLTADQQGRFYQNDASYISNMIDSHSDQDSEQSIEIKSAGYGKAGLNRSVVKNKEALLDGQRSNQPVTHSSLDDFLNTKEKNDAQAIAPVESTEIFLPEEEYEEIQQQEINNINVITSKQNSELLSNLENATSRIDELERMLYKVTKDIERVDKKEPIGLFQLRNTLSSFNICDQFIQRIIKKATFEHNVEQLENVDLIFEFALREMMEAITTDLPLFSSHDSQKTTIVTVLITESNCGQTSMIQKIAALKEDSVLIKFDDSPSDIVEFDTSFASKFFKMEVVNARSIAEIVSECRKSSENGKSIFIDYKISTKEENKTKKFIDGLRRSFEKVEVLISLSAIQSELYNKSICNKYATISNGIVVSNIDSCLNFGALFNISDQFTNLPYKFFGTGEIVPNDVETASAERILAGIFQFN